MQRTNGRPDRAGFTMIELMIVVVIVAILASIAIPIYGKYIKNSRTSEATSKLAEIVTGAKSHALANPDALGNPTWPPAAGGGLVDLSSTNLFDYAITSGGSANASTTALTVTATGTTGKKMAGVTVSMTVPNIRSTGSMTVDLGSGASGGSSGTAEDTGGTGTGSGSGDGGGDGGDDGDGGDGEGDGSGHGHWHGHDH